MTPSTRLLALLGLAGLGPLAVVFPGIPYFAGLLIVIAALIVAAADRIWGCGSDISVVRRAEEVFSVGVDNEVTLELYNAGRYPVSLEVVDEPPITGTTAPEGPQALTLGARERQLVTFFFTPNRRGLYRFTAVQMRFPSRLGLWRVHVRQPLVTEVQVFPNIEALSRFELLARKNNLAELGFMATRMRGDGHEFERMREYRSGDEPRRVDWKTTARMGRLIVREMGQERNQNIVFLVDMGRMMQQTEGGLSHFDHALNTAIMLGHIATKKGDCIGAVLFSDDVHRVIPLTRGRSAVDALVHATYDLEPDGGATDYSKAFQYVMNNVNRRSLVLLMTHFVPGDDQRLIRAYTRQIGRQHLPLCLFFKEASLEAELCQPPAKVSDAYRKGAAAALVMDRVSALGALRHQGVMAVDATPGEFTAHAISHYLDIKARNLL